MNWNRTLLANSSKSIRSCFLNAVSFLVGVGTNSQPRERRLIWSVVISELERFFMYFLFVSVFLAIISLCVFLFLSVCFLFFNLRFSTVTPLLFASYTVR